MPTREQEPKLWRFGNSTMKSCYLRGQMHLHWSVGWPVTHCQDTDCHVHTSWKILVLQILRGNKININIYSFRDMKRTRSKYAIPSGWDAFPMPFCRWYPSIILRETLHERITCKCFLAQEILASIKLLMSTYISYNHGQKSYISTLSGARRG